MVRVISQETYDETVVENIEEFDMTPSDAIADAIHQFEAQGVDLTNIIKDLALTDSKEHRVSTAIDNIKKLFADSNVSENVLINELGILKAECDKDIAHRLRAGNEGAYNILLNALDKSLSNDKSEIIIHSLLVCMISLMDMQPDLLEDNGTNLILRILKGGRSDDILTATLKWTSICCISHENNRQNFVSLGIIDCIRDLLSVDNNERRLIETLSVIRKLTLDDDIRVEFGKAHDHARELAVQTLAKLTELMKKHTKPPLVQDLMLTIATVMVRNEFCQTVADAGGITVITSVLTDNFDNVHIIQQAYKLLTALAGNDDVKRLIIRTGIAPLLIALLEKYVSNVTATALSLKCISCLTLREPIHSIQFLESGAPEVIVRAMKVHKNSSIVQKMSCWAIRNMVARCRAYNSKFHELGIQELLDDAHAAYGKEFGFDIKSALRDLECDVKLDEQWTGKGVQMTN